MLVTARQLEVDSFPARHGILQARRDRNLARLEESRLAMERSDLRAPFDAMVSHVAVAAGDRVSPGQVMVALFPLDALEIRAHLPTAYIDTVQQAIDAGVRLQATAARRASGSTFPLLRLAGAAETTGVDAFFRIRRDDSGFRPGELLALDLELPAVNGVIAVPYQAIYGNSRIYLVEDGRLRAVEVETVGQVHAAGQKAQVLIRSDQVADGDLIAATHLPNAVSGLKVEHVD